MPIDLVGALPLCSLYPALPDWEKKKETSQHMAGWSPMSGVRGVSARYKFVSSNSNRVQGARAPQYK